MESMAYAAAVSPVAKDSLAITNGVISSAIEAATMYIWDDPGEGPRLVVIGRRDIVADAVFHILVDKESPFIPFRPGSGLIDGDPLDIVFSSTQPLNAKTEIKIDVRSEGKRMRMGTFDVRNQKLVGGGVQSWNLIYGFPFPLARAEAAERQREGLVLLDNFRALKNSWPQLRSPAVATQKNATLPIPDVEHRVRIGGKVAPGDVDGSRFINHGYTQLKSLLSIAEVYGCELTADTNILDWGVGCGRIARHMPPILHRGLAGIDVDSTNIAWCQENIPFGHFNTVDPYGRTSFEDKQFDLIYSLSVLTHLSEQDQFHWLEELARISRGIMVLSVSGLFGTHSRKWARSPDKLWRYLSHGFSYDNKNLSPAIEDVTPSGYYRSSSHTPAYIYANWTRFVDVVDIISGGVGTRQDAVICRPWAQK